LPQEAGAADHLAQLAVRELQRNGWCEDWAPINILGTMSVPEERLLR
jgi:hypothetical protein